jgi:predicted AlkP superfamily pyrophosphatase or phosphodiesterase
MLRTLIVAVAPTMFAVSAVAQDLPKLVLQITVDQLRGDIIDRFNAGLGAKGFNLLTENGVHYANAHHRHANTETIVGHATLATGADPAVHGMVANLWFDRESGTQFYNVQDADFPLVDPAGSGASGVDENAEIDPTQRAATTDGRSPRAILTSTIADEIALHFGPSSKVFGISVKDRGAISMAGHAGQAYWFSKSDARFVTSQFYRDAYPDWVEAWNNGGHVQGYSNQDWVLRDAIETYQFADRDDQHWETNFPGFGRVFPHAFGSDQGKLFTTRLTLSPAGDALTVDFAKALIDSEDIGRDSVTDYLSVSLSSTDYVGHLFGPSSLEAEDNMRRLDDTLADLLSYVDQAVGLANTLVVLSSDHGAPEHPAFLKTLGIEANTFGFSRTETDPAMLRLEAEFGESIGFIHSFSNPYLYLDYAAITAAGHDPNQFTDRLASELEHMNGIARALPSYRLRNASIARNQINDAVLANFHTDRSGDIYVVFDPHWFIADFDGLTVASAHGSPWTYDTHVPIIVSGPGIEPARVTRRVETVDVAPTIATFLGTKPPSGSSGEPLAEVFQ